VAVRRPEPSTSCCRGRARAGSMSWPQPMRQGGKLGKHVASAARARKFARKFADWTEVLAAEAQVTKRANSEGDRGPAIGRGAGRRDRLSTKRLEARGKFSTARHCDGTPVFGFGLIEDVLDHSAAG